MATKEHNSEETSATAGDGSLRIKEREFRGDPETWARQADDASRVVVTSDDGEHVRFVIIQQHEPFELE